MNQSASFQKTPVKTMEGFFEEGTANSTKDCQQVDDDEQQSDNSSSSLHRWFSSWNRNRPTAIALMVIFLGLAATAAFLGLGIISAFSAANEDFEQSSSILIQQVEIAWKDYEVAALWTHQACTSHDGFSHQDFRELYEQLLSTEIDTQIEFLPYVTHAEREMHEEQTREYYAREYPYIDYKGFVGLEPVNGTDELVLLPRSDQDFYFPIHFIEPIAGSEPALDLDVYSFSGPSLTIDKALQTWKPALSEPARLVEETVPHAFAVFLMHPGTPLSTQPDLRPQGLSLLVIRIPDLIERATQTRARSTSVFLYDMTNVVEDDDSIEADDDSEGELFLGGIELTVSSSSDTKDIDDDIEKTFVLFPPTPLAVIRRNSRLIQEQVISIADREWTIAVVAVDGTYEPQLMFVIVGAILLVLCSICIAAWIYSNIRYSNMRKEAKLREVQTSSETEKAALVLDNATRAAQAERTLNDYIAHEVRNPLSSAISACSFVQAAVREPVPLSNEASRQSVRDDVDIIDNSLTFINDLLRNMLDMHRASSNQLKIETKLTDLYNDVLKPVDSMLYRRGNSNIQVILECDPPNLIVNTDPLRLKQVILNLGRNSSKFVERGFIRLSARVVNGLAQLSVEDSGPGIPDEKRKTLLFAKFQESLDSLNQGTGIGLYLCKKLIELMNGRVWLDESYDSGIENCRGTRFVIDLNVPPSSLEDVALVGHDTDPEYVPSHPKKANITDNGAVIDTSFSMTEEVTDQRELPSNLSVLFVDDDMVVRKLFCRAVRKVAPAWTIHEASNGETALQLATEGGHHYDLIFCDQYMASIQKQLLGTETVRELRARGVDSIVCGFSANDMEAQFVEAGADAFMMKPFPCQKEQLSLELKRILFDIEKRRAHSFMKGEEAESIP